MVERDYRGFICKKAERWRRRAMVERLSV